MDRLVTSIDPVESPNPFVQDPTSNRILKNNAGHRTTTWDYENQRVLYQQPAGRRVTMQYNADNRCVRKES